MLANAREHLPRYGALFIAAYEKDDNDLVERGDKSKQCTGNHAGQDQGHDDSEKSSGWVGTQICRRTNQYLVESAQGSRDRDDDKWCAKGRMRQYDSEKGALQSDLGVEEIHASGRDDQGHDHR